MLFVTFSSCEKDLYEESIKKDNHTKSEILTGKEAEKVALRLKNLLGSHSSLNNSEFRRTITLDIGTINYDEILKLIDSYGKENYTFEIRYPIEDDKKFGNLILQEKDNYTTVKLIEYYMTDAFAQEYKLNYDLKQFQGNIKFIPIFTDNPCPDPVLIIQIGNVSSNGGGIGNSTNPSYGNPNIFNNGGHGMFIMGGGSYSVDFDDSWQDNTPPDVSNGPLEHYHHYYIKISQPINPTDPSQPSDPCPPNTEIGILLPVDRCSKSFLEGLSPADRAWLYNHNEEHNDIMDYIKNNTNCVEANQIAKEILKEEKRGSKVDYVNKIIIDSSFVTNQKAMCVYNKMKNINAFNKALEPFETTTPVAFLKLKTDDLGNDGTRAVTNSPDDNNIITITINSNLFSIDGINGQPNLLLAQSIIHEVIHAEFYREIMAAISVGSYSADPDIVKNALMTSDYERLSDYFRLGHDWQHSYMADHYRNAIARVTQEYATGTPVTGTPDPLYTNLAWRGLMNYGLVTAWTQIVGPDPNNESPTASSIRSTIETYTNSNANQSCQ